MQQLNGANGMQSDVSNNELVDLPALKYKSIKSGLFIHRLYHSWSILSGRNLKKLF